MKAQKMAQITLGFLWGTGLTILWWIYQSGIAFEGFIVIPVIISMLTVFTFVNNFV